VEENNGIIYNAYTKGRVYHDTDPFVFTSDIDHHSGTDGDASPVTADTVRTGKTHTIIFLGEKRFFARLLRASREYSAGNNSQNNGGKRRTAASGIGGTDKSDRAAAGEIT
jgi:hypothetical protein